MQSVIFHISAFIGNEWRHHTVTDPRELSEDVKSYQMNDIPYSVAKEVKDE